MFRLICLFVEKLDGTFHLQINIAYAMFWYQTNCKLASYGWKKKHAYTECLIFASIEIQNFINFNWSCNPSKSFCWCYSASNCQSVMKFVFTISISNPIKWIEHVWTFYFVLVSGKLSKINAMSWKMLFGTGRNCRFTDNSINWCLGFVEKQKKWLKYCCWNGDCMCMQGAAALYVHVISQMH